MGLSKVASISLLPGISSLSYTLSLCLSTGSFLQSINYRLSALYLHFENKKQSSPCFNTAAMLVATAIFILHGFSPSYFLWLLQDNSVDHLQKTAPVPLNAKANGCFSIPHVYWASHIDTTGHLQPFLSVTLAKLYSLLVLICLATCSFCSFVCCWLFFLCPPYKPIVLDLKKNYLQLQFATREGYQGEWGMGMVG